MVTTQQQQPGRPGRTDGKRRSTGATVAMVLGGLALIGIPLLVVILYVIAQVAATTFVRAQLDAAILDARDEVTITYEDVDVDLFDLEARVLGLTLVPVGVEGEATIDEIVVHRIRPGRTDAPSSLHLEMIGLRTGEEGPGSEEIEALGYDRVRTDFAIDYDWDEATGDLRIDELSVGAPDVGTVTMRLHVSGIDPDALEGGNPEAELERIRLHSMSMAYDDDSLMGRLVTWAAADQGMEAEDALELATSALEMQIDTIRDTQARKSLRAMRRFLQRGGELEVSVEPTKPVSMDRLATMDPARMMKTLKLRVVSRGASLERGLEEGRRAIEDGRIVIAGSPFGAGGMDPMRVPPPGFGDPPPGFPGGGFDPYADPGWRPPDDGWQRELEALREEARGEPEPPPLRPGDLDPDTGLRVGPREMEAKRAFRAIPLSEVPDHVGKTVRLTITGGGIRKGELTAADATTFRVEREDLGVSMPVAAADVVRAEVLGD